MKFKHLQYANQSYLEHLRDSLKFVGMSLQAAFYFTVHSVYPDLFERHGSQVIKKLNDILQAKIENLENVPLTNETNHSEYVSLANEVV